MIKKHTLYLSLITLALTACILQPEASRASEEKLSKPGFYKGYSAPLYEKYSRKSLYLPIPSDGTKIAIDIYRPLENGTSKVVETPLPAVLTTSRYHRINEIDGKVQPLEKDHLNSYAAEFIKYGYVVVITDVRGAGASFGAYRGPFSPQESQDASSIIAWLARQDWCTGKVGMFGQSYLGITQYMAAGQRPPALKAIFPQFALWDFYATIFHNGVFVNGFMEGWSDQVNILDANVTYDDKLFPAATVDADPRGVMRAHATEEHGANGSIYEEYRHLLYRNSVNREGVEVWKRNAPYVQAQALEDSGIPIYSLGGWYDCFTRGAFLPFKTLPNKQKVIVGPWPHCQTPGFDNSIECIRWFDYHLKGIDNGIMDEPPITYFTINTPPGREWRTSDAWPLKNQKVTPYYFSAGTAGAGESVNDGALSMTEPTAAKGVDTYKTDYGTTTGTHSRWLHAATGVEFQRQVRNDEDRKALTYTTAPLEEDTEVTGNPEVHLWVASPLSDANFFVYLEDVDQEGKALYVTEGMIKASHRKISYPPYALGDIPYHSGETEDIEPLNVDEPAELRFSLLPTSYIFTQGHRIRVSITCADKDNFYTPESPLPSWVLLAFSGSRTTGARPGQRVCRFQRGSG